MNETPYSDISSKEFMERINSGGLFVFKGERYTVPKHLPKQLKGHTGKFFEVSSDKILSVAQHLSKDNEPLSQTITKAYQLICEAEVFSRNLRHWNEKTLRNHMPKSIYELVSEHEITSKKDHGKVLRLHLISSFLKANGRESNKTAAGRIFNRWILETLRLQDFKEVVPWKPGSKNWDPEISTKLCNKGWIRWVSLNDNDYLVVPDNHSKPLTQPRRKPHEGDHETRPWWGTKTTWWPSPSKEVTKSFRKKYLCDRDKHFRNAYLAGQCLEKFARWLQVEDAIVDQLGGRQKSAS